MGEHKIKDKPNVPTRVRVEFFVDKSEHELLAHLAKRQSVPVSTLVWNLVVIGLQSLINTADTAEEKKENE